MSPLRIIQAVVVGIVLLSALGLLLPAHAQGTPAALTLQAGDILNGECIGNHVDIQVLMDGASFNIHCVGNAKPAPTPLYLYQDNGFLIQWTNECNGALIVTNLGGNLSRAECTVAPAPTNP